ncbi:MAG: threonine/serine exporter family protein [Acidobacteria bacterium]|nr:threonine/serine exporter family protein [Acidobacteriota bacterium]
MADPTLDGPISFVLKLGRALQAYGTPAHRLEDTLEAVAKRLGIEAQFFGMPTGFIVSFGEGPHGRTFVQRVPPQDVDLARLDDAFAVTDALLGGRTSAEEAADRLDAIASRRPRFDGSKEIAAFTLVAACFGVLLGGGGRDLLAAGVIGAALGSLHRLTLRFQTLARLHLVLASLVAALVAQAIAWRWGGFSPQLAMLAGLIMLLPGLSITIALNELATGNLVAGTSRFAGSLVVLLQLAFGAAIGQKLGALLGPVTGGIQPAPGWMQWPCVLLAPIAITVLLKGRLRDLGWLWIIGFAAFGGTLLGSKFFGPEMGLGLGALMAGLGSNAFSRLRRRPSLVALLPTLFVLAPGSVGLRSFAFLAQNDVYSGMDAAFRTAFLAFALVAGLLIANAAFPPRRAL